MMAETEVSREAPEEASKVVRIEEKCGLDKSSYQDLPKPDCNGTNHHNQVNDLDNSYVFVTGADGISDDAIDDKDVVAQDRGVSFESKTASVEDQGAELDSQNEKLDLVGGEVHESLNEGENGNVELIKRDEEGVQVSDPDSPDQNVEKIESSAVGEVKQVDDPDGKIESLAEAEVENVENQNGKIEGVAEGQQEKFDDRALQLVAESGENGESNSISSNINSSGNGNDEFEDQINSNSTETLEACQESLEVTVDVLERELEDVREKAEDEEKLVREVVDTAEHVVPASTSSDFDQINSNTIETSSVACQESREVAVDVVERELEDVREEAEAEIKLMKEVVETAEYIVLAPTSSDLDQINSNTTETSEACQESREVVVDVVERELEDVREEAEDGEKLIREVVDTAEHVVPASTSSDFDQIKSNTIETPVACQESREVAVDVVERDLEDVREEADIEVEVKLMKEVVETAEHVVLASTSSDLDQINSNTTETSEACRESREVVVDVVERELKDVREEAEDEEKLVREVVDVDTAEHVVPASTSSDLDQITSDTIETLIACQEPREASVDVVACELEDVRDEAEAEAEIKLVREVVQTAEHVVCSPTSSDLDQINSNTTETSNINSSGDGNDEFEDQINSNKIETLVACQKSQEVAVDVVEPILEDVREEAEDEVKLVREVVETAEHLVPPSTSSDLDLELSPTNNEEKLKEEVETTLSLDVNENRQFDTAREDDVQGVLEQIDEAKTASSLVLEEKDKDDFVSDAENGVKNSEEAGETPDRNGVSDETMQETKTEVSVPTETFAASNADAPQNEIEISEAEAIRAVSSSLVDGPESQIIEKGLSGSDCTLDTVVLTENKQTFQGGEADGETEVSSGKVKVANSPPATSDEKLEPQSHVHKFSATSSGEKTDEESAANIALEVEDAEDVGDQLDAAVGSNNKNMVLEENEETGNSYSNNLSVELAEGSSENMIDGEASVKIKTKPFNFLIRMPRFDDESLREQIRLAKLQVDEKTKLRDAIRVQIQEKRANSQIHGIDYEFAKGEARSARKLVRSKRMEIDSLQSVINKAKNALSIEDIDSQIYNMEHMIQHETLPLKEEKQLLREIKQLKQLREQLSSNMGSQDEIKQALEQREEIEDRLKILRKELDILKDSVLKAEAAAMGAEKKYEDENKKVKELQSQFRAADDVRQAAYAQWQNLRKELSKKNKHFFKYKDDAAIASNYAFSRDTEALYSLCQNHVENFMELWNTNDEFRREYIRFNTRSTVRRLGTLDGRSLGPDEDPPTLPGFVNGRANRMAPTPAKVDQESQIPTPELKQEPIIESKPTEKMAENKNQKMTNKGREKPVEMNASNSVSDRDVSDDVPEEPKNSREEIEAIRKAEETRKAEAEAKLKEQRRLEELAKAKEARERKKRQAEKLQMRAELKTQKEAEQKEKEREKRLRKKERKKAAATDANDVNSNCETGPSSESTVESSKDIEVKETPSVPPKKSQKPWLFTKQTKTKSVPPPLRNRNKKKLQQWMWVGITSLIILVLFWLGNIGVFSNVNLKRRSSLH